MNSNTIIEIWEHIPGYEGWYQVSNTGKVRRIRPTVDCGIEVIRELKCTYYPTHDDVIIALKKTNESAKFYTLASIMKQVFLKKTGILGFRDGDPTNYNLYNLFIRDRKSTQNKLPVKIAANLTRKTLSPKRLENFCKKWDVTAGAVYFHVLKNEKRNNNE